MIETTRTYRNQPTDAEPAGRILITHADTDPDDPFTAMAVGGDIVISYEAHGQPDGAGWWITFVDMDGGRIGWDTPAGATADEALATLKEAGIHVDPV